MSRGSVSTWSAVLERIVTVGRARGLHLRGAARRRGVDDDDGAPRVVTDAVGHVAQQEFLAPRHAGVAHHQHVDRVLLGGRDDRHRGVVVDHDVRVTAFAGDLQRVGAEFLRGAGSPGRLGGAVLRDAGVLGHQHDLDDVQLGPERLGERRGPLDGALGGLGTIGADHDPVDRTGHSCWGGDVHGRVVHGRIMAARTRVAKVSAMRDAWGRTAPPRWCQHHAGLPPRRISGEGH